MSTLPLAEQAVVRPLPRNKEILKALDIQVPQVKAPAAYGVALGLLVACLLLIASAFAALLAFLAWLIVWHLRSAVVSFQQGPYFIFHVPMALLGVLLLVFLLKPLYFRSKAKESHILKLTATDEPLLFEFVAKLCHATKSQRPAYIEIDCDANAGARLRSVIGGDLVLRIGLPLVAAMPVHQLSGVLAHEFGHFNQRSGMRGAYLIRRLTFFFAQIVFQRDRLDARLAALRASRNGLAQLFYFLAVAIIEPTRGVLWLMLILGELLTCHTMRRMEYDADHFAGHVSGMQDFVRTSRLMAFLSIAAQQSRYDLQQAWTERRLADDLPRMIVANARQLSDQRDDILKALEKNKTNWIDTHPCHNDRVKNVQRLGATGLVTCDISSRHLFADFDGLCKRATEAYYCSVLGKDFSSAKLVPTTELVEGRAEERQAYKSLRRFFRGQVAQGRPVLPEAQASSPLHDLAKATAELRSAREEMMRLAKAMSNPAEAYEGAAANVAAAEAQLALCGLFPRNPRVGRVHQKASEQLRINRHRLNGANENLNPFELLAKRRLTTSLQLLQNDQVMQRLGAEGAAAQQKAQALLDVCQTLRPHLDTFLSLREQALTIRVLCSAHNPRLQHPPLVRRILQTNENVTNLLTDLQKNLTAIPYPFEHGTAGVTMGTAIVQRLPKKQDPVDTHACAMMCFDRFSAILFRTLGNLSQYGEQVEAALGMDPLPEPPAKDHKAIAAEKARTAKNNRRYWFGYSARAAVGVALLSILIWFSIDPPTLPAMSWGDAPAMPYRPAAFGVNTSVSNFTNFTQYTPLPPRGFSGYPGYPIPGQPGYQPGIQQPGYPGYRPQQPNNQGYRPYQPPSYSPPSYSPGGGFRGGGGGGPSPGGHR